MDMCVVRGVTMYRHGSQVLHSERTDKEPAGRDDDETGTSCGKRQQKSSKRSSKYLSEIGTFNLVFLRWTARMKVEE